MKIQGRIKLTAIDADGERVDEWESTNTGCILGLNDLVAVIAYQGAQDIADNIGATPSIMTPLYGAIGGPTAPAVINTSTDSTTTLVPPSGSVAGTFSSVSAGSVVLGTGIPAGTTVVSAAADGSTISLSTNPTFTGSVALSFIPPAPFAVLSTVTSGSNTITQQSGGVLTNPYLNVGIGWAATAVDLPSGTTVSAVSTDYATVTLSNNATGTSTSESVMFSPYAPAATDTQLFNEFPTGTGRSVVAAVASAQGTSTSNPPTFTWQFQFPLNSGSDITVTEVGVFTGATSTADSGNILNHALINPPAIWASGQMLMASITLSLTP